MSLKQNKDDLLQMMETDMATNTVAECNVCNGKDECLSTFQHSLAGKGIR